MPNDVPATINERIDPATVAAIAREVIARLRANSTASPTSSPEPTSKTNQTAVAIHDRIVTVNIVEQLSGAPTQAFIAKHAIVTPAAADEASRRGITMVRSVDVPPDQQIKHGTLEITDTSNPERAEAVRSQLARRAVGGRSAKIVLSDTPAREVFQQCTSAREAAVMITSLNDVHRFAVELTPTVWVLDMKRLNIATAVNVVAQITQIGNQTS